MDVLFAANCNCCKYIPNSGVVISIFIFNNVKICSKYEPTFILSSINFL